MSEPRHLYDYGERLIGRHRGATFILDTRRTRDDRGPKATYVLAGGPEYAALISRVVPALASILRKAQGVRDPETGVEIDVGRECLELRAVYDWLEGTP